MDQGTSIKDHITRLLWQQRLEDLPRWRASIVWLGRLIYALVRDITQGFLTLQAMSLVYTTLLSLVPLLAVSFSVLKGFGVHNQLEPVLLSALAPLGERGAEITQRIIGFVDNMQVGVLGSMGLALLIYTVISLIQKIEEAFNYTWRVPTQRSFTQRFSRYLSVLMVGPVLFFSAVGLSASVRSNAFVQAVLAIEPMGTLLEWAGRLIPYLMISLAFAFIYVFVPNTRVRLTSAMIGALVAGFLWQSVGWLFAHFMVSSTRYTAIYSGLAILILFMIWVYIAWLILLIGASIAFYHQHPEYLTIRSRDLRLSNRLRERLALLVAGHVARAYETGAPAWTNEALAAALGVPKPNTERMLYMLQEQGFITGTAADPPRFMPARAPESIRVKDLLNAVRCFEEHDSGCKGTAPDPVIDDIEHHVDAAIEEALTGVSLKDLADRLQPPGPAVLVDRQADPRGLPDDRALSSEAELSPRIAERD